MQHILIPTDFSESAENAAAYAIHHFKSVEARFTLLHVHDFSSLGDETIEDCESKLRDAATLFPDPHHEVIHIVETALGSGSVVDSILRNAKDRDVDMVIMGTKSKSRPRWMGSYAEEVVLRAKCPVLIVPDHASFKTPERVIMPVAPDSLPPTRQIEQLLSILGQNSPLIEILSVIKSDPEKEGIRDSITSWVDNRFSCNIHIIKNTDISESILDFGSRVQADMLILFPKRRGLFKHMLQKSVSKKVAHMSSLPLLSIALDR